MEAQVAKTYLFLENYELWLQKIGLSLQFAQFTKVTTSILAIIIFAIVANWIAKKIIVTGLSAITKRTKNTWDNFLVERKVFHRLSHLAPALVIQFSIGIALYDYNPSLTHLIEKFTYIYIIIVWMMVIGSLFNALHDIYLTLDISKDKPIKGYVQLVKIIVYVIGGILVVSYLFEKDPTKLLVGLGTSAAILTLVFKDTILGLVASIQASANNMVKPGDWIEMPGRGADGTVLEISLNTVKVQNWDRTISTFPTYALVSESFTNWKGMMESDGRRIKRSIFIDTSSVKFCSEELLEKLKRIQLIKGYIEERSKEIEEFNVEMGFDTEMPVNGRRLTNLGIFRQYLVLYLKAHPGINSEATCMVRQLQPTEKGIPLEVYCFSSDKAWVNYEGIQSDIFDHILASISQFNLKIFQNPSGTDFQKALPGA